MKRKKVKYSDNKDVSRTFELLTRLIEGVKYPIPREDMYLEMRLNDYSSKLKRPSNKEIENAMQEHVEGNCKGEMVYDHPGYMYDVRHCAICGKILGCI